MELLFCNLSQVRKNRHLSWSIPALQPKTQRKAPTFAAIFLSWGVARMPTLGLKLARCLLHRSFKAREHPATAHYPTV